MATTSDLFSYYKSNGKTLPSIAARREIYAAAGLGKDYAGTPSQNDALLNYLSQSKIAPLSAKQVPTQVAPSAPPVNAQAQLPDGVGQQLDPNGQLFLFNFNDNGAAAVSPGESDPTMDPASMSPENNQTANSGMWLYNKADGTARPIPSYDALAKSTGLTVDQLKSITHTVPSSFIQSDPDLSSAHFLPANYSMQADGSLPPVPDSYKTVKPADESADTVYGKQPASDDMLSAKANTVFATLQMAVNDGVIKKIPDADQFNRYVSAAVYGLYSPVDILKDAVAKESGKSDYAIISPTVPKSTYGNTAEYVQAAHDPSVNLPSKYLTMSDAMLNENIFSPKMANAMKVLAAPLDVNSQQYKDQLDQVQAAWYDVAMQQANATNSRDKEVADANWQSLKANIEARYNIQLSESSRTAWQQFQQLQQADAQKNLTGSGIEAGSRDAMLNDARRSNALTRAYAQTHLDYYARNNPGSLRNNGSPDEIKAEVARLDAIDKANGVDPSQYQSVKMGYRPSDAPTMQAKYPDGTTKMLSAADYFSTANLKKLYPKASDAQIAQLGQSIDENGNFRSDNSLNLQQKLYGDASVKDSTGLVQEKSITQADQLTQTNKDAYDAAMANYVHHDANNPAPPGLGDFNNPTPKDKNVVTGTMAPDALTQPAAPKVPTPSAAPNTNPITLKRGSGTMQVMGSDADYWKKQGWSQ